MYHVMYLFTLSVFAEYSFSLPTECGLRLRRPGCLVPCRDGLPVQRRSPIQALTGSSVEYRNYITQTCYRYTKPATKTSHNSANGHFQQPQQRLWMRTGTWCNTCGMRLSGPDGRCVAAPPCAVMWTDKHWSQRIVTAFVWCAALSSVYRST